MFMFWNVNVDSPPISEGKEPTCNERFGVTANFP